MRPLRGDGHGDKAAVPVRKVFNPVWAREAIRGDSYKTAEIRYTRMISRGTRPSGKACYDALECVQFMDGSSSHIFFMCSILKADGALGIAVKMSGSQFMIEWPDFQV